MNPDGETQITRLAPYWRIAVVRPVGTGMWEIGAFGLAADTYPGRDSSAGLDRLVDIGIDSQYQVSFGQSDFMAMISLIHEHQSWHASQLLGHTSNQVDRLDDFKTTANYLYDKTWGLTAQYFKKSGGSDELLYAGSANGSPQSDGFVLQANYLPFNKAGGPEFWPRSNVKFSLQYTLYNHFDGAKLNYDGAGANARDNNTLYLEAWILF